MLGFRWIQRIRLPFGIRSSISRNGVGFSWGVPGARIGLSPTGRKWISFGFPSIGLNFFKYLGIKKTEISNVITDEKNNIDVLNLDQNNIHKIIEDNSQHILSVNKKSSLLIKKWKNIK